MKRILVTCLTVLFSVGIVFAASIKTTYRPTSNLADHSPQDVQLIKLHDIGVAADDRDTMLTTDINVYGPYSLSSSNGTGMYAGFHLFFDLLTGTTPVAAFDYSFCGSADLKDTLGGWVSVDTLAEANENSYRSLASTAMKYIVFRINNYDGSTTTVPKRIWVLFKENFSYQFKK